MTTGTKTSSNVLTCGETGEHVFVAAATSKDIQHPPSSFKRKILYKVPSAKTRADLYDQLALCLEDCESKRLPKYGGRPWQVICRVSDSQNGSPFFRFLRGKLELAVLPHLLEKIPERPKFPGYTQTDQGLVRMGSEQCELTKEEGMETLEISTLSQVAWDHRNDAKSGAPLPTIALEWKCPLGQTFNSRELAWDHALELANAELFVDRCLKGRGKLGLLLKPFRPTKAEALQVGKVRFLRDGLWVVGQEQGWQNERFLTLEQTAQPPLKKPRTTTGINLFLEIHRVAYQDKLGGQHVPTNHKGAAREGMPVQAKKNSSFSLKDADKELRNVWRNKLSEEEKNIWGFKANSSFQRQLDLDDKKRLDLAKLEEKHQEKAAIELAPKEQRIMWEVFSQAEHECWKGGATVPAAKTRWPMAKTQQPISPEFDACQSLVFQALFEMTPGEYQEERLKGMTKSEMRRQNLEMELLEKGMKRLTAPANRVLRKRMDQLFLDATNGAKRRKQNSSPPTSILRSPLLDPMLMCAEKGPDHGNDQDPLEEGEEATRFVPNKHFCLTDDQIKFCYDASMEHFDAVMRTVKAKDLTRELVDGFDLLRERGRGRYDMELPAFETEKFDFLNDIKKSPWMPIVRQVLGGDVVLIHKGCFLSLPDATDQNYHQDGLHLHTTSQKPCHAVNVFTPLVDMTLQHGPTEFCLGSHILGQEDWDRRYTKTPLQKKGVPVMFDYRLGHRGLANKSKDPRPIVYCTYARAADGDKVFRDSVNFSGRRYHKLGDLVDKPMSREERNEKRRK